MGKPRFARLLLLLLTAEKVVQHAFVTVAFVFDLFGLRQEVVVDYRVLAVAGGFVGALFLVALIGLAQGRRWALVLTAGLAAFDIVGEFVAQGKLFIVITVSFIVAVLILFMSLRELRRSTASALGRP